MYTKFILLTLLILPSVVLAQETGFVPLVGIPFVETSQATNISDYVNSLYLAAISIAAFLAVVKIIFAGVQYMLSEVVTDKEQAKKSIYGAVIGLLIVLGAFLILNTINPQLTTLRNLDDGPEGFREMQAERRERPSDFDAICGQIGGEGNCKRTSCETFDSQNNEDSFMGWLAWGSGYNAVSTITDSALNRLSCARKCSLLGGQRVTEWTSSGECIYPENQEQARQNVLQYETMTLQNEYAELPSIPDGSIVRTCSNLGRQQFNCGAAENFCQNEGYTSIESRRITDGTGPIEVVICANAE